MTEITDRLIELGRLAMEFGLIDRTACYHPDRKTRESDTDHTVMLGWLAPAFAQRYYPWMDIGLIAQFALIHDMPEIYAGDISTLRIDAAGLAGKKAREAIAVRLLCHKFAASLAWVGWTVTLYEDQQRPEARFVRGLDKCLPKIVHLLDEATGLREEGMGSEELRTFFVHQREGMLAYVGDFPELIALHAELADRVVALVEKQEADRG